MAEHDGIQHFFFRSFISAAFYHHDSFFRTGYGNIHGRLCQLFLGGVYHILSIYPADTDTGNGAIPGNIGNTDGSRSPQHAAQLRRIVVVHRQHRSHHMHIVAAAFIKKRTDRTVNQTGIQNGGISRTAFTTQESSGHLAYGIHLFFIIHGQGEEISSLPRFLAGSSSHQHYRIAVSHQYSTIGLLCHLAGLNNKRTTGQFHLKCLEHSFSSCNQ